MNKLYELYLNIIKNRYQLDRKIIFIHIPKTGGTSIQKAIESTIIGSTKRTSVNNAFNSLSLLSNKELLNRPEYIQKFLLAYFLNEKHNIITGHFHFDEAIYQKYKNEYDFITIVRNPIDRFISHFFYFKTKPTLYKKITENLNDFLKTPEAKYQGALITRTFSGSTTDNPDITLAKENANKFSLIGDTNHLDSFSQKFFEKHKIRLDIKRLNITKRKTKFAKSITPDQMIKIKTLCELDLKFYKIIKHKFI